MSYCELQLGRHYEVQDRGFETPCWVWLMCKTWDGYGYSKRIGTPVHRALYKKHVRDLPRSVLLHHRCEQKDCINPAHLEEMTHAVHNALHKIGKKLNISDEERELRRERGRRVGTEFGARLAYTKQSRSEVAKRTWDARKAA